ncbi:MAG TPA: transglutaminase domain-containing protein [Pyrinomonadaceae bacterium]|nr:transglutaminase domain-containing protein [Pyrinomonadaceae bacterium]
MRKLLLLLVCLLCSSANFSLKAQVTRQQAREAEWKSYSLPATKFSRYVTPDKKLVFRVPADWKQEGPDLLFNGPNGAVMSVRVDQVADGYPLTDFVASVLKGVRESGGLMENPLIRRTQFQDLEAREIFHESTNSEGRTFRNVTWFTISGPLVIGVNFRTPVEQATAVEPFFKATVQSLTLTPDNYAEFDSLRTASLKTPAPGPLDEIQDIVATLVELNSDREAAVNRLTPLFVSQPDAVIDLLLDRRVAVRSAASEALVRSKNATLNSLLWHALEDPDPFVAEPAARRLASESDTVMRDLLNPIVKGKTETIARLWPFLTKENRITVMQAVFNPTVKRDPKFLMATLMLLETMPAQDFKTPLTRVMAVKNDPLTIVALRMAIERGESLPVDQLLKLAGSQNKQIKELAIESMGQSAAVADIPRLTSSLGKDSDELQLVSRKIQFRHDFSLSKSAQQTRELIQKADASIADFAWRHDCESTIAGCTTQRNVPSDFKVQPFGENLFPQKVLHYAAIPNPAQAVERFYQTLHGLQLDSPRAQASLVLMMGKIRQDFAEDLGAPPEAMALIDYTGIKPDSPVVLGSWTAPGARDTTSAAHRKAIVMRVKDRERFERSVEAFQQKTGDLMALVDYAGGSARAIAAFPALLPLAAQMALDDEQDKPEVDPDVNYSFIGQTEWNGIPIKTISYRSIDAKGNVDGDTVCLAFVGDVAILTADVPALRELLTTATASDAQLLAANEEFRRSKESDGDFVYFSDLLALFPEPPDTSKEPSKKANESGALKFANSLWENSHRIVFDESEWSKPLLSFHPKELSAPRDLLPASTIAYYLMKLNVADAFEKWPKSLNLRDRFEKEQALFALDFKQEVATELGPECGAALLELPGLESIDDATWAVFCKLKSAKLTEALTNGKLLRGVGPTTSFAEVKSDDASYFVTIKHGFIVVSNKSKGLTAFDDKRQLADTRDYSRAAEKAPTGIVAFGGYNLEAAVNAASANNVEGLRGQVAGIIFSVASAFHSQSFYATASAGAIEGRSSVAMDREGRYAVADFTYLPRGANITFATIEPSGAPINDQNRISNLVLKVRAKAPGPIDSIRDDIKTPAQSVEQKSANELVVTIAARRSSGDKKIQLPVTEPSLSAFLKATGEFAANDKSVIDQAKQIAGDDRDAWSVARKLADWTYNNLEWKSVSRAGAAETLATREADCSEFSQLYVAMARSLGLPARLVSGLAHSGTSFGGHAWVEVWAGEWVELDPTWGTHFVDATHIRNTNGSLVTAASLNMIDLEVLETRRSVSEFQKSAKALTDHLVKAITLAEKSDVEASLDVATLTDEFMGQGSWDGLNEDERDQIFSAYRRFLREILIGFGKADSPGNLRLLHLDEKGDRAEALCLTVSDDMLLKLQLVRREGVWRLVDVVQTDSGLALAVETLGPVINSIRDVRAGKKPTPATSSEFVKTMELINRDPAKGVEAADRVLQTKPGDKSFRLAKAFGLFGQNKDDEGMKLLTELSDEQPAYPPAVYLLARRETEPAKAVELYKRYSLLEPYDPRAYRNVAGLHETHKQIPLAEAAYRKALEVDPRDDTAYADLISMLVTNDRLGETGALFVAADKHLSADVDLLADTLNLLYEMELEDAEQLVATQPQRMKTSARANVALGNIYLYNERYVLGLKFMNQAAQIDPKLVDARIGMSDAYIRLSQLSQALAAADHAVKLDPESGNAVYRRACALARLGRRKEALAALEKALELDATVRFMIADDPDLNTLRSLPAFKKLMDQ